MKRKDAPGPKGPSEKNPFKGAGAKDETAVHNPTDTLTEQQQRKDTGPMSRERDVGQFSGRGRPPLQKK